MQTVTLTALLHKQTECIGIYFSNTATLNIAIKKIRGIKWSQTHKCWWLPLSKDNYTALATAINGIAVINHSDLKEYMMQKNTHAAPTFISTESKKHPTSLQPYKKKYTGGSFYLFR
jgi:hypothetical protein